MLSDIMVDPIEIVGKKMKLLRKNRGLTQSALAKLIGLSRVSIANIETGNQKPTLKAAYTMAIVLNEDINELLPSKKDVLSTIDIDGADKDFLISALSFKGEIK